VSRGEPVTFPAVIPNAAAFSETDEACEDWHCGWLHLSAVSTVEDSAPVSAKRNNDSLRAYTDHPWVAAEIHTDEGVARQLLLAVLSPLPFRYDCLNTRETQDCSGFFLRAHLQNVIVRIVHFLEKKKKKYGFAVLT
jgi:hypothetical protein